MTDKTEKKKLPIAGNKFSALALALFLAAMMVVGVFVIYPSIRSRIIDVSLKNMEELSRHDELSLETGIDLKWSTIRGIADHIRQVKPETTEELAIKLSTCKGLIECIRLTLIDDEGNTVSSNLTISTVGDDESILEDYTSDHYIYCVESLRAATEGRREVMVIGSKITPFEVDGHTYTRIAAIMDIDILRSEIKIDSYDGEGLSMVIDSEGRYVVKTDRDYTAQTEETFFTALDNGRPDGKLTADSIRENMKIGKTFSATFSNEDGESFFLCFLPMTVSDWYFITAVPMSVFEQQTSSLVFIFMMMITVLLVVISLAVYIILKRRRGMLEAAQRHRRELADALVLAEQANRAKTTFLNNMSHDIRTPMNAIIGFTALAGTHIDNTERVKEYLTKITKSSNHLLSLINDVLDMSRIESGKMSLDEKPESLVEILHTLRDIVQADIHSKQLDLFMDIADVTNENIRCDKLRLNQVLLNLVSNAIKFTPPGGMISIRIIQTAVSGSDTDKTGTYQFIVKDNGIGMSEEFKSTIFDPFTRERSSTVSGIQGTGLGMSITKNIVDMMGGTITVDSHEGSGTEFTVTLTFKLCGETAPIGIIKKLEGLRGLVVDDDMNSCQSVSQMLRQVGMRAEWARYGKEAVVRTKEAIRIGDRYELYIIDWLMPDMNGIETARRIRQAVGADAPIIILTAYDFTDIEEEAREAGVTEFVSKPVFPSELHTILRRITETTDEKPDTPDSFETTLRKLRGKRLLLAEDDELNREIASELLHEAGFEVETAENGEIEVKMLSESKPGYYSAVLTDIQMPIMDGYAAAKAIRALDNKELASIPIIAMTANAFEEDRQAAFEAGMNAHVSKPINVKILLQTILDNIK